MTLEGTRYTTSSTNDFNEAVKSINSITGYKEEIKKSGVYAIHIEYLYSENTIWDELLEKGINQSNNHVDFMIGTKDLVIEAITPDGTIKIFDGNFIND